MHRDYGLRPDSIDYDKFRIDADVKTLYWTHGDKQSLTSTTRRGIRFLALSKLASWYGVGGIDALRRSLGLTGYTRKGLGDSAVKAPQQAYRTLPSKLNNTELEDLSGIADSAHQSADQVETTLTTIDDQPIDTVWVTKARRELAGLERAMTGVRDELANNLAKLTSIDDRKSAVERHLARKHRKLPETDDTEMQREIRDRIRKRRLPSNLDNISGMADSAHQSEEQVETTLTTTDDQTIDTVWVTQARRELAGLEKAMTGVRDELANNLAKLTSIDDRKSEVKRHLAREHQNCRKQTTLKCKERFEIRDRIRKLESVLSDIELERQAWLEAHSTNRATLRLRSTESVRHSDGSSMKTPHWLCAFAPCFVSKELPSH